MAFGFNPRALFHLVPRNGVAHEALQWPGNRQFVSQSSIAELGLEVGFHVPNKPGRVIARLGRDADLILPQREVSSVHTAFEFRAETGLVMFLVMPKSPWPTFVARTTGTTKEVTMGDCMIFYGVEYTITFAGYEFLLAWKAGNEASLRAFPAKEYEEGLGQLALIRTRYLPTEYAPDDATWYQTRLQMVAQSTLRETRDICREQVGNGSFGSVYKAFDVTSGRAFAIKVIHLSKYPNVEHARTVAHREIKLLQRLNHKHIIKLLGIDKWESLDPEIFMPLRQGNLRSLMGPGQPWSAECVAQTMLEQMLSAIDYLACDGIVHRDIKPDNILYYTSGSGPVFELADFGLANHVHAAVTWCGTVCYEAPEIYLESDGRRQSPKVDVWSLLATFAEAHPSLSFQARQYNKYADVLCAVRTAAAAMPQIAPMAREDPDLRASAAQMLVILFDGRGLTTPRAMVPPPAC